MTKLFVYGTLAKDLPITHRLPGYMMFKIRGQNFDFPVIQPYPWNKNVPDVYGAVIEVTDEQLVELDKYEGVDRFLYSRVDAIAYEGGKAVAAPVPVQVYIGGPALINEPIPSGVWRT